VGGEEIPRTWQEEESGCQDQCTGVIVAIGLVLVVVAFRLRSWWLFVCGPSRWLIVVVEAEQPGSWARGFRNVGSSPTVVVEVRCDRTRRRGTRQGPGPQLAFPSWAEGPNKDPTGSISFGCVCVSVGPSVSRNCEVLLFG